MELSIEDIQNKFEKLPEDLKWAIMGARIDEKLVQIGQKFNLNIRQLGQLSLETHAVMLGFMHPDDFEHSINKSLGLSEDKIKEISDEINLKILKDVKDRLIEYRGGMKPEKDIVEKKLPKEIFEKKEKETKEEKENKIDTILQKDKQIVGGIINNKLINTVKSTNTETEHKNETIENKNTLKKIDPYREIPE